MRLANCMMVGVLAIAGATSSATAGLLPWNIAIQFGDSTWNAGAPENSQFSEVTKVPGANGGVAFRIVGSRIDPLSWSANWDLLLDQDPFVSSNFSITNNTGSLQIFTITTTTPSMPLANPTVISGSVSGFVGDGNGLVDQFGNGGTVRTQGGNPFYEALVDGVGVRSLYTDPTTASAPLFQTNTIATQNFGGGAGPGIIATIGIRNNFELTAGDNAGFTNTFLIVVPSPAGFGLFGALGLVALRRRR